MIEWHLQIMKSLTICFSSFFFSFFFLRERSHPLRFYSTILHNDIGTHQNHCERCRSQTQDHCISMQSGSLPVSRLITTTFTSRSSFWKSCFVLRAQVISRLKLAVFVNLHVLHPRGCKLRSFTGNLSFFHNHLHIFQIKLPVIRPFSQSYRLLWFDWELYFLQMKGSQ